jgi:SP family general alpha glucoside:H+ symporter-like MFS transporter
MSQVSDLKEDISPSHLEEVSSSEIHLQDAKDGTMADHNLSPWQAVKAYPMAIFWSLVVSCCVIMEGYDTILIGKFGRC